MAAISTTEYKVRYRTASVDGIKIFYREAGDAKAPARELHLVVAGPSEKRRVDDLFLDYASNVVLYPKFQEYFRTMRPPVLAVWGKNDPLFLPPGAEAFKRDNPEAEVHFCDTGHFALETHVDLDRLPRLTMR